MVLARQAPPFGNAAAMSSWRSSIQAAQESSRPSQNGPPHDEEGDDHDEDESRTSDIPFGSTTFKTGVKATTSSSLGDVSATSGSGGVTSTSFSTMTSSSQPTQMLYGGPGMPTGSSWDLPPWHSPVASSTDSIGSSSSDSAGSNPTLQLQQKSHDGPNTAVIAGVVVPIVLLLAGGFVFLACLRRRRRRHAATMDVNSNGTAEATAMVEKVASKKVDVDQPPPTLVTTTLSPIDEAMVAPQRPQLVITSPQNPTYFTGLDTFSVHSANTTEDPPPPYRARSVLSHRSSEQHSRGGATNNTALAPISPVSPISHLASPFSDSHAVALMRSSSQRSFASTLYSSNASVYEARPARRSTGPAEYVISARPSADEQVRMRSPFEDPEDESDDERRNVR